METSVTFPGLPAIVPSARRFARGMLAGSPRAEDMELITAELASNAIRHTPSGADGGEFTLTVRTEPGWARIEVSDAGTGQWSGPRDAADERAAVREKGRGIAEAVRGPGCVMGSPVLYFHPFRGWLLRVQGSRGRGHGDRATGLPLAWQVQTAKDSEIPMVPVLPDSMMERGFAAQIAVLDRGYDTTALYDLFESRDIRPVIPLRQTPAVKAGKHKPPSCEHGTWTFAGSDAKRGASKWRCPTGQCKPASLWIKASRLHTLIPRTTDRWKGYYCQRGAVEREFGRLKHEWSMLPLRVRRIYRVRLHVDLTILAQLASALLAARTP